jgi:hypothetical protein
MNSPVTRWGAALQGARTPQWFAPAPAECALGLDLRPRDARVLIAGRYGLELVSGEATGTAAAGFAGTVMPMTGAAAAAGYAAAKGATGALAQPLSVASKRQGVKVPAPIAVPNDNRKQYSHQTRVNANGGGAPGPEPEREQALQKGQPDPLQAVDPLTGSAA